MLVLGVAYKPDIDDTRESPALKLIELLRAEGADVSYHDPHVPRAARVSGSRRSPLEPAIGRSDCVVVVTAHTVDRLRRPRGAGAARRRLPQRDRDRRGSANGKVVKL